MDLKKALIDSRKAPKRGALKSTIASLAVHALLLGGIVAASLSSTEKVAAEEKAIPVFVQHAAAPPPPPPPPPPPAASSSAPKSTPQQSRPIVRPTPRTFTAPTETPKEVPLPTSSQVAGEDEPVVSDEPSAPSTESVPGGVEGGVEGGQAGGVMGGTVGGEVGGTIGGEVGGVAGGTLGGEVGGTGDQPAAPPEVPSGPVRVGGDVKAPTVVKKFDPEYTEAARKARVTGVVIVEAVIDKEGNVDRVKIIRGLPMGLGDAAEAAVRRWKFKPGTLNGQPVDVIFNLTVVFQLSGDAGGSGSE